MSGKDVNKFTISDEDLKSKLTFKATAFEAGSDNTYSPHCQDSWLRLQ
jgi:hypothetical protein